MIDAIARPLDRLGDAALPLLARFAFAATLASYYWASARTKLGDGFLGLFDPTAGGYVQIFPRAMEAVGYDTSQLGAFHRAVVVLATAAEFILPALVILGLATRLAALGMIVFVAVQSLVDITGHGADAGTIGAWFDRDPSAAILDQRLFWVLALAVLVMKGGGALALDRLLQRRSAARTSSPQPR